VENSASIAAPALPLNALQNTIHPTDMKNVITKLDRRFLKEVSGLEVEYFQWDNDSSAVARLYEAAKLTQVTIR
jgi:hypothetical protein